MLLMDREVPIEDKRDWSIVEWDSLMMYCQLEKIIGDELLRVDDEILHPIDGTRIFLC